MKCTLYDSAVNRLTSIGYNFQTTDLDLLLFCIQKTENHIINTCNTIAIPSGLMAVAIDMVCGEFLYVKKQSGMLDEFFNLEKAIETVRSGDTDVTFDIIQSPDRRLSALINYLSYKSEGELLCYRKLNW